MGRIDATGHGNSCGSAKGRITVSRHRADGRWRRSVCSAMIPDWLPSRPPSSRSPWPRLAASSGQRSIPDIRLSNRVRSRRDGCSLWRRDVGARIERAAGLLAMRFARGRHVFDRAAAISLRGAAWLIKAWYLARRTAVDPKAGLPRRRIRGWPADDARRRGHGRREDHCLVQVVQPSIPLAAGARRAPRWSAKATLNSAGAATAACPSI